MKNLLIILLLYGVSINSFASDTIQFGHGHFLKNSHAGTRDMFVVKYQFPVLVDSFRIIQSPFKVEYQDVNCDSSVWRYEYKWGTGANGYTLSSKIFVKPGFYYFEANKILVDTIYQIGTLYKNQKTKTSIVITKPGLFSRLKLIFYKLIF